MTVWLLLGTSRVHLFKGTYEQGEEACFPVHPPNAEPIIWESKKIVNTVAIEDSKDGDASDAVMYVE